MNIQALGITDVGQTRNENQDHYLINDEACLWVVADGMGGYAGGETASQIAVTTIEEVIVHLHQAPQFLERLNGAGSPYAAKLRYAIRLAGKRIFEAAQREPTLSGMGTTAVALWYADGQLHLAHVGDSRAYRVRGGEIHQITADHSLVAEQVRAGLITAEDARNHRLRNIITRAVGNMEDVEVDTSVVDMEPGDTWVMCSDGLSGPVEDAEILEIVSQDSIVDAGEQLIGLANDRGGEDNITAIIVHFAEE